jgi:tetratricopeptide (TPR) repeat protein
MHSLAQTRYWQAAQSGGQLERAGPEIARLSAVALRHSAGLPIRDSMHIGAFYAFQQGDYATARERYRSLLTADSTDVYAWLMLGSVEFRDRWLEEKSPGSLAPRSNLNVATRAFSEAVRLQPTFDLGYGHLFEMYQTITDPIDGRGCGGFELPRDELIAPWGDQSPYRARAFCAVVLDSIEWVTKPAFDSLDASLVETGAIRLFDQSVQSIRRWADFAPSLAQPREEIAAAMLARRARLRVAAPESIDSLARLALESATQALALTRDTLPVDLLRLGSLYLGVGDLAEADALTEEALKRYGGVGSAGETPPRSAPNVFLALGQPMRALSLVSNPTKEAFRPDTVADSLIAYGGAEVVLDRIRVLGATGVGGSLLRRELAELHRIWSPPRYSERQVRLLRRAETLDLAVALALDDSALAAWDDELGLDAPLWRALVVSQRDSVTARALLRQAMETETPTISGATRTFLLGLTAARIGDHGQAAELFGALDSLPLQLSRLDMGWGLRSLSYLLRARSFKENRDSARAVEYFERFVSTRSRADSLTMPLVDEARSNLRLLKPR